MSRYCGKCGNKIKENELFCSKCGNKINKENEEQLFCAKQTENNKIIKNKVNGLSIGGFVCSIIGFLTCGLTSLVGLVLSIIGLQKSKKSEVKDGFALSGIIISSIVMGLWILGIIFIMSPSELVKVEDFSTMTHEEALKFCDESILNCTFKEEYSDTIPKGEFISQSIEAGKEIESYITVDIVYSKGLKAESEKSLEDKSNNTQSNNISETKPTTPAKTKEEIKNEYKASCQLYDYKTIARQPEQYKGQKARFRGEVIQVSEGIVNSKKIELRVNVTEGEYGFWEDTVYVTYTYKDGELKILEDDIINMYGTIEGTTTYVSVLGAKITLPSFKAEYIEIEQ